MKFEAYCMCFEKADYLTNQVVFLSNSEFKINSVIQSGKIKNVVA